MQIGNMWKASPCAHRGSCTEFCSYKKLVMKSWAYECHGLKQQVGMGKLMKEKVAMLSRDSKAFHCKNDRCSCFSPFSLSLRINSTLEKSIWRHNVKGFPANIQKKGKQTKTCIGIFLIENLVECLKNFLRTGSIFLLTFQLKQKKTEKRGRSSFYTITFSPLSLFICHLAQFHWKFHLFLPLQSAASPVERTVYWRADSMTIY